MMARLCYRPAPPLLIYQTFQNVDFNEFLNCRHAQSSAFDFQNPPFCLGSPQNIFMIFLRASTRIVFQSNWHRHVESSSTRCFEQLPNAMFHVYQQELRWTHWTYCIVLYWIGLAWSISYYCCIIVLSKAHDRGAVVKLTFYNYSLVMVRAHL